jgi:hypothetical protein
MANVEMWRKAMPLNGNWAGLANLPARRYRCGFCGDQVASEKGWITDTVIPNTDTHPGQLRVCPICKQPTFFRTFGPPEPGVAQVPGAPVGAVVKHLPPDVGRLYEEAKDCHAASAFTAAVLALRKLLMHIAVEKEAKESLTFVEYVDYLDRRHYLGHDGKGWVDLIRTRSNEANHEIELMTADDSGHLLTLAEMLLKLVYEFPGNLPKPPAETNA